MSLQRASIRESGTILSYAPLVLVYTELPVRRVQTPCSFTVKSRECDGDVEPLRAVKLVLGGKVQISGSCKYASIFFVDEYINLIRRVAHNYHEPEQRAKCAHVRLVLFHTCIHLDAKASSKFVLASDPVRSRAGSTFDA